MANKVKLVIDSVVEDITRIRLLTDEDRFTINVKVEVLAIFLDVEQIIEGNSYKITFENNEDFKTLLSGKIKKAYTLKGSKKVVDTTKEDLERIRKLQRRLGLRRSR
jgi:translation initiation factor IF-1